MRLGRVTACIVTLVLTGVATAHSGGDFAAHHDHRQAERPHGPVHGRHERGGGGHGKDHVPHGGGFANGGETALSNNLSYYRTRMLPNGTESSFWTNFQFSDGQGNINADLCRAH